MNYGEEKNYKSFSEFGKAIRKYAVLQQQADSEKTNWMPPVKYRLASSC
jgi:putative transposase